MDILDLDHASDDNPLIKINDLEARINELERMSHFNLIGRGSSRLTTPGPFSIDESEELTIEGGIIAITKPHIQVDTEGGATTDDLDTINGGAPGDILVVRAADSSHTIVCKDATDNLALGADRSLDHVGDALLLLYTGLTWIELAFANNS